MDTKAKICSILNINTKSISDKYLGLPAMVGVDRSVNLLYLVERVINRVQVWKGMILSLGGKGDPN